MMILEDALLLCFLGLGDFSRTSKRRFFPVEVLTFFFLGSGTNTPGAKSESESTSVMYVTAIRQVQAKIHKPRGAGNEVEWPNTKKSV
jgi:hypothetical protein